MDIPRRRRCAAARPAGSILSGFSRFSHLAIALGSLALGCTNSRDAFIGGRFLQTCNQEWGVCSVIAGCLLGPQTYTDGSLPGDERILIQLKEPSAVTLSLYVDQAASVGTFFQMTWFESGCQQRADVVTTGKDVIQEAQKQGVFARTNNLYDVGDHLVEVQSDAQIQYLFKVDANPIRTVP